MNSYVKNFYKQINDILGLPQEYNGIKLYPLKIGDVDYKISLYRLFFYPKNYIPDKDILKTSYLKYLLYVVQYSMKEKEPDVDSLKELIGFLSFITHIEKNKINIFFNNNPEKEGVFDKINLFLVIDGIEFSEQDFDNIREIVIEQNGSSIEWVESFNPELEEKLSFMQRGQDDVDLKDEVYSFCNLTNLSEKEVCNKTLFQFKARIEREMMAKDYNLFKPLELTGQISSKNKQEIFKHYLTHIPRHDRYESVLIDLDKFVKDSGLNDSESGLKFEK